jgi:hypothetical protein
MPAVGERVTLQFDEAHLHLFDPDTTARISGEHARV